MIKVADSLSELADSVVYLRINCNAKQYPTEFQTYDEGWESLNQSLSRFRTTLSEARHAQLIDMAAQARAHFDAEAQDEHEGFLGSWLMQDIEQVVRGKPPFAYPEDMYRWPRESRAD
ncbi:MAG: hypothetical protein AB7O91_01080 [Sphingomonas sp.]